jgi:hypothetical protein
VSRGTSALLQKILNPGSVTSFPGCFEAIAEIVDLPGCAE